MKKAWEDIKSFMTVSMVLLLFIIVIASLFGATLGQEILLIITNLATSIFTYYYNKKDNTNNTENTENAEEETE